MTTETEATLTASHTLPAAVGNSEHGSRQASHAEVPSAAPARP
ncbi:hypothetical protein AHiyo4_46440 [Arthrobacter sp. Hiyo4]|nr:hypothetical protein AHiyo4_46440 [Arthrobacter sp. Hiyo4]